MSAEWSHETARHHYERTPLAVSKWTSFDPHGPLVQHVHIHTRSEGGVWTERAYTYRFPDGVAKAIEREQQRGRTTAFRFCGEADERPYLAGIKVVPR